MTTPFIQIQDLSYSRGHKTIFDGMTLDIHEGRITAVMGPSGTGKTTLLKLIGAQLKPDSGRVLVNGEDVHRMSHAQLYRLRRKMGMLFQSGALLTDLSVFENVAFPYREHTKLPEVMIRDLVLMKLEAVGLRGARDLMPAQLSGGMARRVALARAIALDPELIMYDEPFTGLDPITMATIVTLIKRLKEAMSITSILVSHDVAETLSIADDVFLISGGKVVDQGTSESLQNTTNEWSQQFLQALPDGPVPFHYPAVPYEDDVLTGLSR